MELGLVDLANAIYRDFETDGVPASGLHKPRKPKIREWGTWVESAVNTAFTSGSSVTFFNKADLDANLGFPSKTLAWVTNDANPANNGIYQKNGASGTGSWSRVLDLPYSFIRLFDAGAGTANAIVATSSISLPASPSAALLVMNVFEANTGAVTIAVNGAAAKPLVTNSGGALAADYLQAGMFITFLDTGTNFRLVTDVASSSIVADAEAAAAAAQAAADDVEAILAGLSPGSTGLEVIQSTTPLAARVAAEVRGRVNFFDFLHATRSSSVREQINNGTFTGDLAVEWGQFRNALNDIATAGGRPRGFIPECKIYSTVAPNFAMDYLTLETQGHVRIQGMGTTQGFQIDGMGLGVGGYGVRHLNIGPLCASSETGSQGIYIRRAHKSDFWGLQSLGGSFAAVHVDGCVTSYFHKPTVSPQAEAFLQTPSVGMYVSGSSGGAGPEPWRAMIPTSWCRFEMPVMEYTGVGIQFDNTYGNFITGGTAEGCSNIGMILGATAEYNKIYGIDLEANTTRDLEVQGLKNSFVDVDSQTIALFTLGNCIRNRVIGGHYNQLTLDSTTKCNLIFGAQVASLTDNSTGSDRNRRIDVVDNAGNWIDRWLAWSPAATAGTGTLTSATATGEYKIRDGDTVDFEITILITTNGTGATNLQVTLPHTVARDECFSGVERVTGVGVNGYALSGTSTLVITKADGTYPGADSRRVIISGTYRRS